jgi:hypothetical protein
MRKFAVRGIEKSNQRPGPLPAPRGQFIPVMLTFRVDPVDRFVLVGLLTVPYQHDFCGHRIPRLFVPLDRAA